MAERSAKQLGLSKADLPNSILEVIATLNKGGFDAYIVGGGVRDTLLGLNPKDFDAVTDARPHEVKDLFGKRCRIIGRRFQLAHVYSGRDMIEVATFRAPPNGDAHTTSDGMIVRDNVWGDIEQDFARRDFSINAMYYQPLKGIVHDFCNALDDIKSKTLRLLGHAPVRIEEDPVRLLRALRFKAKLGFEFDKELSEQFHDDNWDLLDQVSPHRLYDESQKMFTGGYLVPLLPLLFEYGAIRHLIIYPPEKPTALVNQVAINTDKRIALGKSINPAFFYAALLWDNYLHQLAKFKKKNMPFHDAQLQAASKVIERQRIKTAIPRFAEQFIRDIWMMQPKLANPRVKQIPQLAEHARFRAAFDFLLLREQCGDELNPLSESTNGMGEWWQIYQTLSDKQKQQAIDDFAGDSRRGKSTRNRNRNRNADNKVDSADTQGANGQHNYQPKPPKLPDEVLSETQNKSAQQSQKGSSKSSHKTQTSAAKYQDHYALERAQLEKLSLGKLVDAAPAKQQPSPLFTISADKLAEQVPQQLTVEAQIKAEADKSAASASKQQHRSEQKANSEQATNTQQGSDAPSQAQKQSQQKQSQQKQAHSSSDTETELSADVVFIPKPEPVPATRRRRQPSQTAATSAQLEKPKQSAQPKQSPKAQDSSDQRKQQSTQKSVAASKSNDDVQQAPKQPAAKQPVKQPQAQKSSSKAEAITPELIAKSERVPATRRRRQPSSELTVNEQK
ncbi:polynucleotide adenylyltransferase PcnB [Psychrobacter sp. FDAARGOS_221]|uniref:polynucleotide adenylyltransferase PcnB n=1 Tax=Psychrobacter sp. FDAARGOS_221 TaxID=1975705 RepID=UPI000BB58E6D|nr:polynucleotide adenylyltransferase PcnB [Psychrobacter sp. FDAARGOS_221]PNK61026.1 polynucleotide adenylyltransferase PcnB [Psychrobacter sp. FDAARGOS_221]